MRGEKEDADHSSIRRQGVGNDGMAALGAQGERREGYREELREMR
jgi:hypothetical protein